jgi:hypothetical protein
MVLLSPLVMVPLLLALLLFVVLSLRNDRGSFTAGPHLALACFCVALVASYVVLALAQFLTPRLGIGYAVLGLVLLLGACAEFVDGWRAL